VTFCEDCEHLHGASKNLHPRLWLCNKFPRLEGQGFVARKAWAENEPFMRCVNINGGLCPCFEEKKNG
jgi:hypothetical protein